MRKVFVMLSLLVSVLATAKSVQFNLFVPNASDEIVIVQNFPTSLDEASVVKNVLQILNGEDGNIEKVSENLYRGAFQTQNYINPFTGNTRRKLKMDLKITVKNGVATLTMTNLIMQEFYAGYGVHEKNNNLNSTMKEYFAAKKMVAEKSGSKKEIKEAKDVIENAEDDIYPSEEELATRLSSIASALK
ncbi:MAG: hypothetical protein MJZ89_05535 [Paludibacteraceae bacterium]|nr:hypothetical protein [Paludibacteraceae bacterium]